MKFLTTTLIGILFLQFIQAQDSSMPVKSQDTITKNKPLNLAVKRFKGKEVTGYLVTIQDSALYVSMTPAAINFNNTNFNYLQKVNYSSIKIARLYNKKKTGRTFLICALTGMVAGAVIGYAGGDDNGWFALTAGGKAVVGGIIGGGVGSIVGGIAIQGMQKKYYIKGEWKNLEDMKTDLQVGK